MSRVKQILCYDPVVAAYILVAVVYVFWTPLGAARLHRANNNDNDGACSGGSDDIENDVMRSVFCNFMFLSLVGVSFCCSLFCM